MKVLLPIIYHELTHCIARAFEEEGHEVRVVDWRQWQKRPYIIAGEVIKAADAFQPDLAFCQFQNSGIATAAMVDHLKSIGCFTVNWAGDVRHPLPQWYLDLAPHFDVTSFSNMTDVELIRAAGYRGEFLQVGYDERIYNTEGTGERSGVVFIGNNYGGYKFAESEGRRDLVIAMEKAFGDQFSVYGMSWEGIANGSYKGYVREPGDAEIYRRSLVAVGWDHFHRPGFASDRLLRATACGCFVVNQFYQGIKEEHPFTCGAANIPHLIHQVRGAFERIDESKEFGQRGAENTLKQHRWNERVKTMMTWLG